MAIKVGFSGVSGKGEWEMAWQNKNVLWAIKPLAILMVEGKNQRHRANGKTSGTKERTGVGPAPTGCWDAGGGVCGVDQRISGAAVLAYPADGGES